MRRDFGYYHILFIILVIMLYLIQPLKFLIVLLTLGTPQDKENLL